AGVRAVATVASDPDIEIEFPDGEGRSTVYVVDPAAFAAASTSPLVIPAAGALVSHTVEQRLAGDAAVIGRDDAPITDDATAGRPSARIVVSPTTAEQLRVEARARALLVAAAPDERAQVRTALAEKFAAAGTVRTIDEVLEARRGAPAVSALVTGTTIA